MTAKPLHYNRGIIRPTPAGTWRARVNWEYHTYQDTFKTLLEAKGWIDRTALTLQSKTRPLTFDEIRDARHALNLLPAGASLLDAARFFSSRHAPPVSISLDDAVDQFLAEQARAGLRDRSRSSLKSHLQRLKDVYTSEPVAALKPGQLLQVLAPYSGWTRDG